MPQDYLQSKSMLKRVGSFTTIVFHKIFLQSCHTYRTKRHGATVMFFCFGKKHSRRSPPKSIKQQVKNSKSILSSLTNKEEEK